MSRKSEGLCKESKTSGGIMCIDLEESTQSSEIRILSEEYNPPEKTISESVLRKNTPSPRDDSGDEEIVFDCKLCGEVYEKFDEIIFHECPKKESTPRKMLHLIDVFDMLQEKKLSQVETESRNCPQKETHKNAKSLSSTKTSPSCKTSTDHSSSTSINPEVENLPHSSRTLGNLEVKKNFTSEILSKSYEESPISKRSNPSSPPYIDVSTRRFRSGRAVKSLSPHASSYSATENQSKSVYDKDYFVKVSKFVTSPRPSPSQFLRNIHSRSLTSVPSYFETENESKSEYFAGYSSPIPAFETFPRSYSLSHLHSYPFTRNLTCPTPLNISPGSRPYNTTQRVSPASDPIKATDSESMHSTPKWFSRSSPIIHDPSSQRLIILFPETEVVKRFSQNSPFIPPNHESLSSETLTEDPSEDAPLQKLFTEDSLRSSQESDNSAENVLFKYKRKKDRHDKYLRLALSKKSYRSPQTSADDSSIGFRNPAEVYHSKSTMVSEETPLQKLFTEDSL